MGAVETVIAGVPARVFRITFSGELGYEIHVPADWGLAVWEHLLERGAPRGIIPYGTEAMGILRIEKGHVAGPEIDGRTTPIDLGFERMLRPDGGYIGHWGLSRPVFGAPGRKQFVGLRGEAPVPIGRPAPGRGARREGRSPDERDDLPRTRDLRRAQPEPGRRHRPRAAARRTLPDRGIAVRRVPVTQENVRVEVCSPHFFDPENARARGLRTRPEGQWPKPESNLLRGARRSERAPPAMYGPGERSSRSTGSARRKRRPSVRTVQSKCWPSVPTGGWP